LAVHKITAHNVARQLILILCYQSPESSYLLTYLLTYLPTN